MTLLGVPFDSAAARFGWGNLRDFANNLPQTSATWRSLHGEEASYASPLQQSAMLADVIDMLSGFAHMFAKAHGGKGQRPEPYPRPWRSDKQSIGSGAIPISEFDEWYYGGEQCQKA